MTGQEILDGIKAGADVVAKYQQLGEGVLQLLAPKIANDPGVKTAEEILAAAVALVEELFGATPKTTPEDVAAAGKKLVDGHEKNVADAKAAEDAKFPPG